MEPTFGRIFKLLGCMAAMLVMTSLHAATLKDGGYVGCLTENHLDQFINAAVKKDERAMQYMLSQPVCVPLNSSYPISLLKSGFTKAHIRVYVGNDAVELWTVREAIQR